MSSVHITLFGQFNILVNGKSALSTLGHSPKSLLLLEYLILNAGMPVEISDLIVAIWPNPKKNTNPINALKTMISRIRSNLSKISPVFDNCIFSKNKSYCWNTEVDCTIDIVLFSKLCDKLDKVTAITPEAHAEFNQILELYTGDIAYLATDDDWIVGRSLMFHNRYVNVVIAYIKLLHLKNDYETIVKVCRAALNIDPFDETFNLEMMRALQKDGQSMTALIQYHHIVSTYDKYFDVEPSEQLTSFYKQLVSTGLELESDINSIKQSLSCENKEKSGAFLCEYSVFRDVFHLQMRSIEHKDTKIFLTIVSVVSDAVENISAAKFDNVMTSLQDILISCLRIGDIITRFGPHQYALLLSMSSEENAQAVMGRIQNAFNDKHNNISYFLQYQLICVS